MISIIVFENYFSFLDKGYTKYYTKLIFRYSLHTYQQATKQVIFFKGLVRQLKFSYNKLS